jgi:hypothetical protein
MAAVTPQRLFPSAGRSPNACEAAKPSHTSTVPSAAIRTGYLCPGERLEHYWRPCASAQPTSGLAPCIVGAIGAMTSDLTRGEIDVGT